MRTLQLAILALMDRQPGVAFTARELRRHTGNSERLVRSALTSLEVSGHVRRVKPASRLHRLPTFIRVQT